MNGRNSFASLVAAIVWCMFVVAAPFAEESLSATPSTSDSWLRGVVVLPVLFFLAIIAAFRIGAWVLQKGFTNYWPFVLLACCVCGLLVLIGAAPIAIVSVSIGMASIYEAMVGILTITLAVVVFAFPAASCWWWLGETAA
jgi:hypothetical protein